MKFHDEKMILPAFPRTPHLSFSTNISPDDVIASEKETDTIFSHQITIEEKIDGASVGMTLHEKEPLIRNREHILRKGYVKETAAKKQFASIWNWFYQNKEKFENLRELGSFCIYGEWCFARHGIAYTKLPDYFIAYDIYDYEKDLFLPSPNSRSILTELGFSIPKLFFQGEFNEGYKNLTNLSEFQSEWADEKVEGIYIKLFDEEKITSRFKLVRNDFVRGKYWDSKKITKNQTT